MRSLMLMWVGVMLSGCLGDYPEYEEPQAEAEREQRRQEAVSASLNLEWVSIEGGSFMMGSESVQSDERPVHRVNVPSFEITKTEVTVAQYQACVEAGWCSDPGCSQNGADHPVTCVDWGQARTFAKWLGENVDLPTEAQWEYAARGGQDFIYAGSDDPDEVAWHDSNSGGSTHSVGTKRANGFGLYDMSGNVWEWTLDEYENSYSGAPSDGSQARGDVPTCSSRCDKGSARRVSRGGGWSFSAGLRRVAFRSNYSPDTRYEYLGVRLRRTLP